jgi:iron complex transport system ATP-binding protein
MVELRDVSFRAGSTVILDGVNVQFRSGQFNVVLGPNGAGKSTLLRVATGLMAPASGDVLYGNRSVRDFDAESLARTRAVLSQHVELAFPLPVSDVVMMGRYPHYKRVPSPRDREIVDRALDMVGMTTKRDQSYPTLSGGEQQKVQLARVLAQIWNADVPEAERVHRFLFLDEPTSSLDVHYQIQLLNLTRELLAHDCTVIAILHDLNTAFEYGTHFVLLDRGRVAHEAERAEDLGQAELERVFRVRARAVNDDGRTFWRFTI